MSNAVFPSLPGLIFPVTKSPMWRTKIQESDSGKETRFGRWSYPRWQYEIGFDFLRSGTAAELQQLAGFFNARRGSFYSWLFRDPDDNTAANQLIGAGDGTTRAFQLARSLGGYVEPVLATNGLAVVTVNGHNANLVQNSSFEVQAGGNRPAGFGPYNNGGISITHTAPAGRTGSVAYGLKANASTSATFGV